MIPVGIHLNVSIKDYHADKDYISASSLKEAAKTMAHFWHYQNKKENERKSHFDFGNAFELALIDALNGSNDFEENCLLYDESERPEQEKGITSKINQEWKKEILNSDKYVLNIDGAESKATMELMLESCWKNDTIRKMIKNTDYQTSIFWIDPKTKIKLKTRPDLIKSKKNILMDIKTCKDASPQGFAKDAAKYDYPLQATVQMQGAIESGLMPHVDAYYWIAIEKEAPYNAQIYHFNPDDWGWNLNRFKSILDLIQIARVTDRWDGYSNPDVNYGILDLELPLWFRG